MQHVPGTKLRSISAKDLNRAIAAGRDRDAGLANLSARDLTRARENGHMLVKNSSGTNQDIYSVLGYTYQGATPEINITNANYDYRRAILIGSSIQLKKHWFNFCILQQYASDGEVVPAAVSGVTLARVSGSSQHTMFARLRQNESYMLAGDFEGQCNLVSQPYGSGGESAGPGLIRIGRLDDLRLLRTTTRITASSCWATLAREVGANSEIEFVAYDPMGLLPPTGAIPNGASMDYYVWAKPWRPYVNPGDDTENVSFDIVSIPRNLMLLGVSGGSTPSPTQNPLFWLN